jgi:LysR family transcriptional regulator, hydrogen peroxide-inducible genes activator
MEMHQIRYFLALCTELNFTRAATRLKVSQPALTRAIKLLEVEFGGPLVRRERQHTHLTELGRMVRPYLEQVYRSAEEAKREAQEFARLRKTPLRLGLMCTIAPARIVDLISAIRSRHPDVELHVLDAVAITLQERLIAGDLDVAIYALPDLSTEGRLCSLSLYREQFVIVTALHHRFSRLDTVRVRDLDGEHYLWRVNCEYDGAADTIFSQQQVDTPTVYQSDRDDWVLAMAAAGLGFAFMPALCVDLPNVVARPLIEPEIWRDVALVTVRGRPHSPSVGALVREAMRIPWIGRPALAVQAAQSALDEDGIEPGQSPSGK